MLNADPEAAHRVAGLIAAVREDDEQRWKDTLLSDVTGERNATYETLSAAVALAFVLANSVAALTGFDHEEIVRQHADALADLALSNPDEEGDTDA